LNATAGANGVVHLTGSAIVAASATTTVAATASATTATAALFGSVTARLALAGRLKTLGLIELLLFLGEGEGYTASCTGNFLRHWSLNLAFN